MKRILLMVLRNLWFVPYGWFKLCYTAGHIEKYTEEERYQVLKMIDRRANIGGRITIDAYGVENIPEQDGFMFFPNHQGLYDVLAILEVCPRPFSVVMKKEVENVKEEDKPEKEPDKETEKEIYKKADKNTEMCEESNEENGDTKDEKSNIDGKDIAAEKCIDKGYAAGNDVQECDQAENDGNREPEEEVLEEWKD